MISVTVVLCVCLPLFSCEVEFNNEIVHLKHTGRFLGLEHVKDLLNKASKLLFGSSVRDKPDNKVAKGYKVETMARDKAAEVFKAAGGTLQKGWEAVVSVEIPGKKTLMYFPDNIVAILDEAAKSIWYIKLIIDKNLPAATVLGNYAALGVINAGLAPVLRQLGADCVQMERLDYGVNSWTIKSIEVAAYTLCGLSSLEPINNVTISNAKGKEKASMLYVIRNLDVKVPSVNVTSIMMNLLDNAPVHARIKKTNVVGNFNFATRDYLKLHKVKLMITDFEGVDVNIQVDDHERSFLTGVTEAISDVLADQVRHAVNTGILKEIEQQLATELAALLF